MAKYEEEELDSFMKTVAEKLAKTNTGGPNLPKANVKGLFQELKSVQEEIGTTPRNAPMKGRAAYRDANPEQRKSAEVYAKYDPLRETLARRFSETTGGPNKLADTRKAVDDTLREMREKNYGEKPYDFQGPAKPEAPAAPSASPSDLPARLGAGSALFPDGIEMPADTPSASRAAPAAAAPKLRDSPTPAAAAPAAGPERDMDALFAKATGTAFDPKSRVDVARKAQLEDLLKSKPELAGKSDTQVALQWYRQTENAKRK
jgi:hypothetical protein